MLAIVIYYLENPRDILRLGSYNIPLRYWSDMEDFAVKIIRKLE